MKYFIRTEETREKAQKAMERNRSIRRWAFAGCHPEEHFMFAITGEEQIEAIREMGYEVDTAEEAYQVFIDEIENEEEKYEELVSTLNLEPLENGGYAEFLPGLCALEEHEAEPKPEDCTEDLNGELMPLLICYEGEEVGVDPDEGWTLFRAERIVWIHETGQDGKRHKEI